MTDSKERGVRKSRIGVVVSNKMDKTCVVQVQRRVRHALYGKEIRRSSTFYAHDEENQVKIGDKVRIQETRPVSKTKRWRVTEVVEASKRA